MASAFAILEGSSLSRDGGTQPYHVIDLQSNDQGKLIEALTAGGLPQKNSPHPSIPGLVAGEPQVVEIHKGGLSARVNVPYTKGESGGGGGGNGVLLRVSGGGSLAVLKTMKDAGGTPIQVLWNTGEKSVNTVPSPNSDNVVKSGGEVDLSEPIIRLRFELSESGPNLFKARNFVGKTNSNNWVMGSPNAWLCSDITFSTEDGEKYTNTYEFITRREGWLQVAAYILPETGKPVPVENSIAAINRNAWPAIEFAGGNGYGPDQRQYNGLTIVRVQGEADFHQLGLPIQLAQ